MPLHQTCNKLAILGGGAVVRNCFLPAAKAIGILGRVTVVDPSAAIRALAPLYPEAELTRGDFQSWLQSCAADEYAAAIIALPNSLHEQAVQLAFQKGLHVLCEKPLALASDVCRNLAEEAQAAGRILAVNMVRRLYPSVLLARFAVERGLIGDLQSVEMEHGSRYSWPAETLSPFRRENGGLLADMGVHYLDLAESFAGELSPCTYEDDNRGGVEGDLCYSLESRNGVRVRIALSRVRSLDNRIVLTGTDGRIEFGVDEFERCLITDRGGSSLELRTVRPYSAGDFRPDFTACFAQQIHDFLECIETGRRPLVDGFAASRAAAHIEWAYAKRQRCAMQPCPGTGRDIASGLKPAPVLITGATGFIGSHLVEALAECGFQEITAAVRGARNCATIARFPIALESLDLLDYEGVRRAIRGKRFVFHLAYGKDGKRPREITVNGTENMVSAAIEEHCECIVILSTMYVFGHSPSVVDESFPYRPIGGEYGRSKAEMERWCLRRAQSSGNTRIVVLNPACVYGPRGGTYSELPVTLAKAQGFGWIDGGSGAANYTFVANLIDAMLLAASHPRAHGERFIINDGTTTWRAFLEPILEPWLSEIRSYTKAELIRIEKRRRLGLLDAVRAAAQNPALRRLVRQTALGELAAAAVRRYWPSALNGHTHREPVSRGDAASQAPAPPSWLADLFSGETSQFSAEKARRVLGWSPRLDLAEGQRRTIRYLEEMNLR